MDKFRLYWNKNWHIWLLIGVMLFVLGVRSWNIEDTLYFRMDQARDAKLIKTAFEGGMGELPLLGPRAAGSFLRLGPAFYYFQFLSAKAFNSVEPYVLAFPDLLFSILTIPLFYYFLRSFFSRKVSFAVVCVFASSFILTQYSRFAWNPNSIPFWALLTLLGAYKCVVIKKPKQAEKWLLVAAFGYAIASQMHFTALLSLPAIIAGFWVFNWPKQIRFKFWALALGIFAFFYIPMAISEAFTKFDNAHQFLYALTTKGTDDVTIKEQLEESLRLHAKYYSMMLTSYGNMKSKEFILAFGFMIIFSVWRFRVAWKSEEWQTKKAFIYLTASWFLVFLVLYTKLAMDISKPRFWLLIAFLPYIFLALLFQWLESFKNKKFAKTMVVGIAGFLIFINMYAVGFWYYSLSTQNEIKGTFSRDLELKQSDLIGIKQMRMVANDWVAISEKNNKKICYRSETAYLYPYEYVLAVYYPNVEAKRTKFADDTNENCSFVSVRHGETKGKNPIEKAHIDEFDVVSKKLYSKTIVWELTRKDEIIEDFQTEEQKNLVEENKNSNEISKKTESVIVDENNFEISEEIDDIAEEDTKTKKLPRKPRVFWKHVFGSQEYKG